MARTEVAIFSPGQVLPVVEAPFAALIDADEKDWQDTHETRRIGKQLLAAGCRWFVCFGQLSETIHDQIENLLMEE